MIPAGTYTAKIMDWGVKHLADQDEYKIFVKFEITDGSFKMQSITWNGSLDATEQTGKNGKSYTRLDITKKNLKDLGFKYGDDLEALVTKNDPFDREEVFLLDVAAFTGNNGNPVTYVRGFESVVRGKDKSGGGSKTREVPREEAASALAKLKFGVKPASLATSQKVAVNDYPDVPF